MKKIAKILLCSLFLLFFSCKSRYMPNYYEVMPTPPKTVFDSILKAKFNLTYFQYRNKTHAMAYKLNNYEGYLTSFDLPSIHTNKFPPIWINGGYAISLNIEEILKYKKILSFSWLPVQNKRNSADVGQLIFHAE